MRNWGIGSVVLLATVGAACSNGPEQPPEQGGATREACVCRKTEGSQKELTIDLGGGVKMEFVLIPAGEFMMGSADSDVLDFGLGRPEHRVEITKPFYLGKYEVTQAQYDQVMGTNPSAFMGDPQRPVEMVSWEDAAEFCGWLSQQAGTVYRLPTEAEWEYACRAGSKTKYYFGDDDIALRDYAWFGVNPGGVTDPVGQKKPNAWGLYDMHGNVWEWCADWLDMGYYASSPAKDPAGPASGNELVLRGGAFDYPPRYLRSAFRFGSPPGHRANDFGFRAARTCD